MSVLLILKHNKKAEKLEYKKMLGPKCPSTPKKSLTSAPAILLERLLADEKNLTLSILHKL